MSDDPRGLLDEAGSRPAPDPDPAFVDALDQRLRAVAASRTQAADAGDPAPGRSPAPRSDRSRRRRLTGAIGALAVAGVVAVAVIGTWTGSAPRQPSTLDAPVNVEVALADGTILEDPAGLVLPDGAVITVGAGGSARIGSTVLEPGDVATVRDGRIDIRHPATGAVASPGGGPPSLAPASPTPTRKPVSLVAPTATPTAARPTPRVTPPPATRTPGPSEVTASATPGTTPTATSATPAIRRPRLRARLLENGRVAVTWTATERARRYVLVVTRSRSGPARDPVYPGSRVLGEFVVPPPTPLRYRVPDGVVETRLMVVALRRDGSVLRRSNIVVVSIPAAGETTGSGDDSPPASLPTPTPALPSSSTPASPSPSPSPDASSGT